MNLIPSINILNSVLPDFKTRQQRHRICPYSLIVALLILLSACSGDGDDQVAAKPEPGTLKSAANTAHQANTAAIGALQRAQALEQAQLQQAERRRQEMEAQGI